MLALATLLFFVASTSSGTTPKMWGSRVIGRPSGSTGIMSYEYKTKYVTYLTNQSVMGLMGIKGNKCMFGEKEVGKPCNKGPGYVNITLNNVTALKMMEIYEDTKTRLLPVSSTFFAPRCKFAPPAKGGVDVWASFPLSRFVKGIPWFTVDFAVQGADADTWASFSINGTNFCHWRGTVLWHKNASFCSDMVKDYRANMRVFHGVFRRKTDVSRETFVFAGTSTTLAVSIDYSQSGISPEVADCMQYGKVKDLSTLTAISPKERTKAKTTSGAALIHAFGGLVASLLMPAIL